jgi:hypothetical protein
MIGICQGHDSFDRLRMVQTIDGKGVWLFLFPSGERFAREVNAPIEIQTVAEDIVGDG